MEPVLDANGQPINGVVRNVDGEGASVKNRLWRGHFISDFEDAEVRYERLWQSFQPRKDDIFILAYLKCGTHWLHEICHFLLTRQADRRPSTKEDTMLECEDYEKMEKLSSPRVLNCHMRYSLLPESIRNSKMIYVVRNAKDTCVSLYHHYISLSDYEYNGTFKGFLHLYEKGILDAGSWFDHTREFLEALQRNEQQNILMVQYEQLKKSPKEEIQRIANFLLGDEASSIDESLLDKICERVSFKSMKADRASDCAEFFNSNSSGAGFYRKGEIGDWKNWMDEEESGRIDRLVEDSLKGLEHLYQPIYN